MLYEVITPIPQDFGNFYEPMGTKAELNKRYDFIEQSAQISYGDTVYALPINANVGGLRITSYNVCYTKLLRQ